MKKIIIILVALSFSFGMFAQIKNVNRSGIRNYELEAITKKPVLKQNNKVNKTDFHAESIKDFDVLFNSSKHLKVIKFDNQRPIWITGRLDKSTLQNRSLADQSMEYLVEAKEIIKSDSPREEWQIISIEEDEIQHNHVRVNQYFNGVKVYGSELILHAKEGVVFQMNGHSFPSPSLIEVSPLIEEKDVESISWNFLKMEAKLISNSSLYPFLEIDRHVEELVIYHKESVPYLAWYVEAYPNPAEKWELFIDAKTGELLHKFKDNCSFVPDFIHENLSLALPPPDGDETANATDLNNDIQTIHTYEAAGTFYLIDASRNMYQGALSNMPNEPVGAIWTIDALHSSPQRNDFNYDHVKSGNNAWGHSPEGVSAHHNGGESYNYFKTVHNRESINGSGGNIVSLVNVTDEDDRNMDNAFWNGAAIFYGNGDTAFEPLAKALDVASHEMTHGVVQATANLEYYGESGAMNEAFADIFASMIDRDDWLIGEDVVKTSVFPSGALRSLSDPHNGQSPGNFNKGWQPKHVSEQFNGAEDNNGVHINSGIPNHAFYLFATAVGKEKAEKVFYRALERYMTRTSKFIDLRLAVVQASEDLYGTTEINAAKSAFDQVGVLGEEGTAPPVDAETNEGLDLLLYTDPGFTKLVLADLTNNLLYDPISNTNPLSRPSVTDDGTAIVFVGSDKKMYLIQIDWTNGSVEETVLQSQAIWANVVIAKDGSRIAAVTDTEENIISVFDFGLGQWADYTLYNPTYTAGVNTGDVLFADAMEFDNTGEWIMYDAKNQLQSSTTGGIEYWDIGFLEVWDRGSNNFANGFIQKLFPAVPEGISVGNPTFSKNSPFIIAFDYANRGDHKILGANIETGTVAEIFSIPTWSYPNYSRSDLQLIYDSNFDFFVDIGILNLQENKIERINGSEAFLRSDARWGVWFSNGARNLNTSTQDLLLGLEELVISPNPFFNEIEIEMTLEQSKKTKLELVSLDGKFLKSKEYSLMEGKNHVSFDTGHLPSGPYILRVVFDKGAIAKLVIRGE